MISIDGLGFHLVIDADISSHGLLIVLELRFDLLRGHIDGLLSDLLVLFGAIILVILELIEHVERLLLLQVEVLQGLVVMARRALVKLRVTAARLLHATY